MVDVASSWVHGHDSISKSSTTGLKTLLAVVLAALVVLTPLVYATSQAQAHAESRYERDRAMCERFTGGRLCDRAYPLDEPGATAVLLRILG